MSEQDLEIKLFHSAVVLKRGEKMPNVLDCVPEDCKLHVGDRVEIDLETLALGDLQRFTQHKLSQWMEYLENHGLALQLIPSNNYNFDLFTVTGRMRKP